MLRHGKRIMTVQGSFAYEFGDASSDRDPGMGPPKSARPGSGGASHCSQCGAHDAGDSRFGPGGSRLRTSGAILGGGDNRPGDAIVAGSRVGDFAPAPDRDRHWRGHRRGLDYLVSAKPSGPRAGNAGDGCNLQSLTPVAERLPLRRHHPGDYRNAHLHPPILDYRASPIPGGLPRYCRGYGCPGALAFAIKYTSVGHRSASRAHIKRHEMSLSGAVLDQLIHLSADGPHAAGDFRQVGDRPGQFRILEYLLEPRTRAMHIIEDLGSRGLQRGNLKIPHRLVEANNQSVHVPKDLVNIGLLQFRGDVAHGVHAWLIDP